MSNSIEKWLDPRSMRAMTEFSPLQESFDRLFNEFMSLRKIGAIQDFSFSPSCEVLDEGHHYIVKADLPGVSKDQVQVELDRDQLTIRAERKDERKNESKKKFLSETFYGSYVRSFTLPGAVDEKKVDAKFENGVLTIQVPKLETTRVKQIPIH